MIRVLILAVVTAGIFMGQLEARAQPASLYHIYISGSCWTTNNSGVIQPIPFNNATLLRQAAAQNGVTNYSSWGLAYHVNGNDFGDTIEIINKNTGDTLQTVLASITVRILAGWLCSAAAAVK